MKRIKQNKTCANKNIIDNDKDAKALVKYLI